MIITTNNLFLCKQKQRNKYGNKLGNLYEKLKSSQVKNNKFQNDKIKIKTKGFHAMAQFMQTKPFSGFWVPMRYALEHFDIKISFE